MSTFTRNAIFQILGGRDVSKPDITRTRTHTHIHAHTHFWKEIILLSQEA